ncbi:MAG: CHAT domain-containing protein [Kofleriaceae bacterium]
MARPSRARRSGRGARDAAPARRPRAGARRDVYVVADDLVRDVTFASLRRHGAYVVERNPVAYALSAATRSIPRPPAGRSPAIVIGDPAGDLPSARLEAVDVGRMLAVKPYVGREATAAVLRAAANAVLLHVASHTDNTARGAAIQLADGPVEAAAVLERPIHTRLVVLLGCSSARAKERDELAALAAAFMAAGAHTVVASLWAVDDAVARRFAHEFYLADGVQDPIRALAHAQRKLIEDGSRVDQWSTFVVLGGSGEALQDKAR